MLRLALIIIGSIFSVYSGAETELTSVPALANKSSQAEESDQLVEYTELEYQLIEASGLLSLSQQVKNSAQRLISTSLETPQAANTEADGTAAKNEDASAVRINHAQHFSIAKNLSKHWIETIWQQRLLDIVHAIPAMDQKLILAQLQAPSVQAALRKERAAISVQESPEYRLYMNKLRQHPPSQPRWQLVESLDKQSLFSQMIIQARLAVIKQIQQQVKGWQPEKLWQNQVRQDVLEFLFYAYRKTPNGELKLITDGFNQPELQKFYKDVLIAIK